MGLYEPRGLVDLVEALGAFLDVEDGAVEDGEVGFGLRAGLDSAGGEGGGDGEGAVEDEVAGRVVGVEDDEEVGAEALEASKTMRAPAAGCSPERVMRRLRHSPRMRPKYAAAGW